MGTNNITLKFLYSNNFIIQISVCWHIQIIIYVFRTPLRNARRKSVTSPRMLRPPGDEESGSNSPAHSVTSNNSFASLLREKIQVTCDKIFEICV